MNKDHKAIGGYFGLTLNQFKPYHTDGMMLNSGRSALIHWLISNQFKTVYLPSFTCYVLAEAALKNGITVKHYSLKEDLSPDFNFDALNSGCAFVYTNYFGIGGELVSSLPKMNEIIIDRSQAFFERPNENQACFYSPRKFFGLPDGGILYGKSESNEKLDQSTSYKRFSHLLKRIDLDAASGYEDFKSNDNTLSEEGMKSMSNLTFELLKNINYDGISKSRRINFDYLEKKLGHLNAFPLKIGTNDIPLTYPFKTPNAPALRKKLIDHKIYTATYWPEILNGETCSAFEKNLSQQTIHLPIDQRYDLNDMNRILELVL